MTKNKNVYLKCDLCNNIVSKDDIEIVYVKINKCKNCSSFSIEQLKKIEELGTNNLVEKKVNSDIEKKVAEIQHKFMSRFFENPEEQK